MDIKFKDFYELLSKAWHRPSTLLISIVFSVLLLGWYFAGVDVKNIELIEIYLIGFSVAIIIAIWFLTVRIWPVRSDKIGILMALALENEDQEKIIGEDFLTTFEKLLREGGETEDLVVKKISSWQAKKLLTINDVSIMMNRINCVVSIYGRGRIRPIDGKDFHILELNSVITHKPIPKLISQKLANDISGIYPTQLEIPIKDFRTLQDLSIYTNLSARYMVGVTLLINKKIVRAQSFLEDLYSRIPHINDVYLNKLRILSSRRLREALSFSAITCYADYKKTKKKPLLDTTEQLCKRILQLDKNDFTGNNLTAIVKFLRDRDTQGAKRLIKKLKGFPGPTWKMSMAFLLAYEGDLRNSKSYYFSAFSSSDSQGVFIESEEFIQEIYDEDGKVELLFVLGFINYHYKKDYILSIEYFNQFIEANPAKFQDEIKESKGYIKKIQSDSDVV
ncbi:hypothetical protein EHQ52_10165 [Leptospira koniambonensis]|uniref:Uncharacterized protein n=1 Tax=Leptospira koniambonensis TaxID=2484950 RepID=A0A4R9J8V9_9LEPT|nr:hypothetical protein [Leptospira koniambonensis]TGL34845.1 hypothetical protein EHQ52_10165 [Leptospira koniambonensis]